MKEAAPLDFVNHLEVGGHSFYMSDVGIMCLRNATALARTHTHTHTRTHTHTHTHTHISISNTGGVQRPAAELAWRGAALLVRASAVSPSLQSFLSTFISKKLGNLSFSVQVLALLILSMRLLALPMYFPLWLNHSITKTHTPCRFIALCVHAAVTCGCVGVC